MSLGKIRQRPVRRRWLFGMTVTAMAVFAALYIASASGVPPTTCAADHGVLQGPPQSPSCFESGDGNMVVDFAGDANSKPDNDWASVKSNAAYFHKTDIASSQSDDSFVSGQKQDTTCPDTTLHGNPPKDDFTDIASYTEQDTATGHQFLYGATIRYTTNGSASENIELKQSNVLCPGQPAGGVTVRTDGDKLLAIDYHPSAPPDFHVLTWTTTGACFVSSDTAPCWGAAVTTLGANGAIGSTNGSTISAANNSISTPAVTLNAGQFAEFGVDLATAGIIPTGSCKAFPQTVWESRSSGSSFVSTTKDISIENKTISNCGEIRVIKQTNPRGLDSNFSFTSNLPAASASTTLTGTACSYTSAVAADGTFTLNDTGNTGKTQGSTACDQNSQGNTVDEASLIAGTYTVTETAPSGSFGFGSVTCTGGTTSTDQTTRTATITLAPNDVVTCLYTNNRLTGALKISKLSAKTGLAVTNAGAVFCYDSTSGCGSVGHAGTSVTDTTDGTSGDSDNAVGSVCVSGVAVGTYYVNETSPPTGYAGPPVADANQSVTVVGGTNCTDNLPAAGATATFHDPPLADVQIRWKDDGSNELSLDGTVASGLSCTTSATTGTQDRTDTTGWKNTLLVPNIQVTSGSTPNVTLTCTVKIDP
jgi:hypothetical protein